MTVNNPSEPEIQISEEKLQKLGWILFGLAVIFTIIGAFVSPLDDRETGTSLAGGQSSGRLQKGSTIMDI